jgi:hypothetical protein
MCSAPSEMVPDPHACVAGAHAAAADRGGRCRAAGGVICFDLCNENTGYAIANPTLIPALKELLDVPFTADCPEGQQDAETFADLRTSGTCTSTTPTPSPRSTRCSTPRRSYRWCSVSSGKAISAAPAASPATTS